MTFNPIEVAASLGLEEGPTVDQVKRGYHGNGVWQPTPDELKTMGENARSKGRERRAERIQAFDDKMVTGLKSAAELQIRLVEEANRIMRECDNQNRKPTKDEIEIIKRGQVAAEKIPDRVIGKSAQKHEHQGQIDLVALISGQGDVGVLDAPLDVTDVEEIEDDSFEDMDDEASW